MIRIGLLFAVALSAQAAEIPGGKTETAAGLPTNTYQLLLSPAYEFNHGAYLTAKMRYQPTDEIGLGAAFGSGERGFRFGIEGIWHAFDAKHYTPAVALLAGAHFNRFALANYFTLEFAPIVSQTFKTTIGEVTPYGAMRVMPSFRLGEPKNELAMKASLGTAFALNGLDGLQIWTEFGLALAASEHEIALGVSYPFAAL
jgi:hypothetical protein